MKVMDPAERNAKQTYALFYAGQQDLDQAAFYANHLQSKGWYLEPWEGSWQNYLHQAAYVTSMVICYGRPFTESRGWPKFPKRILRVLITEQKQLHRHLLDLRNGVYAHTDVAARKNRPITLGEHPSAIEVIPPLKLPPAYASWNILVHRLAALRPASFRPRLTARPLPFASS